MNWEIESILTAAKHVGLAILIAALTAIVVTLVYGVLHRQERDGARRAYWQVVARALPFVFLVAMVGGLCGQLGGSSRTGVVGQLLPAMFTVFGGYVAFYLGAKKDQSGKIAVNSLAFLLAFFFIYNVAATWRQGNEALDFCRGVYSNPAYAAPDQRADRDRIWSTYCTSAVSLFTRTPPATTSKPTQGPSG